MSFASLDTRDSGERKNVRSGYILQFPSLDDWLKIVLLGYGFSIKLEGCWLIKQ